MTTVNTYTLLDGTPAAEWSTETADYQLVGWPSKVLLGCKPKSTGEWSNIWVVEPERFGPFGTPTEFKAWVEAFTLGGLDG